ncbi:MAG: AMP-binding protein [Albidovulum sp.]|nr:AMP-binding protein [Albidovulum sp.]
MGWMEYEAGLERCAANFVPLTPLSHLVRAKEVFPRREALVYGSQRRCYLEYFERVSRFASSLASDGIDSGDVVATILPNVPAQAEAHFGVPACGAVLNTINTKLEASTISYILDHGGAKALFVDSQFLSLAERAVGGMEGPPPRIIEVSDSQAGYPASGRFEEYEDFLSRGDGEFPWRLPEDEWQSLALNYTSGTTGRPKGVVYHHRGAYLMTMGTVVSWRITLYPRYLAVVPLYHCNGWNHTWMMPLLGGAVVCLRNISAADIYSAVADESITHFGGAPIILNLIANSAAAERREFEGKIEVYTAGAPPAAATLRAVEALNFNVTHVYGLTETYGHVTECVWNDDDWDNLANEERAALKARQGVAFPMMESVAVVDSDTGAPIARDGKSLGEIVMRGNSVMKGYYRNSEATRESLREGHFRTGDIAVQHADGYIQIADRAKDIIISGGENVSSVEIEGAVMNHPAVSLCAVVAMPDEKWGEVPCAFVELKDGHSPTEEDLIAFCRNSLSGFKVPKRFVFQTLPKTSTGKIQKFQLREAAKSI